MMLSEKLITLLNKTLKEEQVSDELKNYHFVNVNRISTRSGWLVEPDACNQSTLAWANGLHYNPNSTFYKNWAQVKESSDFGLFLNQCMHYITTYGTNFQAEPFVINNNPIELSYKDFRVLRAVPEQEIIDDLVKLLESGIAMDAQTVKSIVDFFVERNKLNTLDLTKVKNKEAQAMIAIHVVNNGGKLPNDEFCILRALTYAIIEDTNVINSDAFIAFIRRMHGMCNDYKKTSVKKLLKSLTEDQLKSLAKIFRRYKKVFLAIRLFEPKVVNRIRRLSDKYHRPFEKGFWEKVVSDTNKNNLSIAESKVDEINNFKKAQILQSILLRELKPETGFFHIRNGKTFIKENYKPVYEQDYHTRLKYILLDSLSKSLTKKYRKEDGSLPFVVLPKNIELAFPISEKNFIGNIPSGSHVDLGSDVSIGIYWENAWGTSDFDLHFADFEGNRYGWCYGYRDSQRNIMYSGDMTDAENGASELYKINGKVDIGGTVTVAEYHRYSGKDSTKFKFFVAKNKDDTKPEVNYMVDPNDIIFDTFIEITEVSDNSVATILDGKLYFTNENIGCNRVPNKSTTDIYNQIIGKKLKSNVTIKSVLENAGFNIITNVDSIPQELREGIIDLSNMSKADIINFCS
jgi:hypothetical protein